MKRPRHCEQDSCGALKTAAESKVKKQGFGLDPRRWGTDQASRKIRKNTYVCFEVVRDHTRRMCYPHAIPRWRASGSGVNCGSSSQVHLSCPVHLTATPKDLGLNRAKSTGKQHPPPSRQLICDTCTSRTAPRFVIGAGIAYAIAGPGLVVGGGVATT